MPLQYYMRGHHPDGYFVNWKVDNTPDATGAQSGFPGLLTNIGINNIINTTSIIETADGYVDDRAINASAASPNDGLSAVLSVRLAGAIGDGSHNDTTAIQAAATACAAAGGGILWFPRSTNYYKITSAINIGTGVSIVLDGEIRQTTASTEVFRIDTKSKVSIRGGTIRGAAAASGVTQDVGAYGIVCLDSTDVQIEGVKFTQLGDHSIFDSGSTALRVTKCRFFNTFHGIFLNKTTGGHITDNEWDTTSATATAISYPIRLGSKVSGIHCTKIVIHGNRMSGYPNGQQILIQSGDDIVITNNVCTGAGDGIGMGLTVNGDTCNNLLIANNHVSHAGTGNCTDGGNSSYIAHGHPAGGGPDVAYPATNIAIIGNTSTDANKILKTNTNGGVGRLTDLAGLTIEGNVVNDGYANGIYIGANVVNMVVSNNVLRSLHAGGDSTHVGINIQPSNHTGIISRNEIDTVRLGIFKATASDDLDIFDNRVRNEIIAKHSGCSGGVPQYIEATTDQSTGADTFQSFSPALTLTLVTGANALIMRGSVCADNSLTVGGGGPSGFIIGLFLDTVQIQGAEGTCSGVPTFNQQTAVVQKKSVVAAGSHTVELKWKRNPVGGTTACDVATRPTTDHAELMVYEVSI